MFPSPVRFVPVTPHFSGSRGHGSQGNTIVRDNFERLKEKPGNRQQQHISALAEARKTLDELERLRDQNNGETEKTED